MNSTGSAALSEFALQQPLEAALGPAPGENEFLRHALQTAAKRGRDPRARWTLIEEAGMAVHRLLGCYTWTE